jgi:aldehyde dehydrogenase (NAD+)
VKTSKGKIAGQAGHGNRKDVRNAVEAALKASMWSTATGHNRAQVLYYIAENLSVRADEFVKRLATFGASAKAAQTEVDAALQRIFFYAAHADKYDGRVHSTNMKRMTALAMNEPYGVMALVAPDEAPLLAMISMMMPVLAMGNRVVLVPSQVQPLIATDFYQVLDTSDVPDGVVNIITGGRDELAKTLAEHDEVAAMWYHGDAGGCAAVEKASAGNLKNVWSNQGKRLDWLDAAQGQGAEYLRRAVQVKNIWIPYGE